jgi:hypothetical protein
LRGGAWHPQIQKWKSPKIPALRAGPCESSSSQSVDMQVAQSIMHSSLARFLVAPDRMTVAAAHQVTLSAGPAACATPPRPAPQGAACWFHVHSGSIAVHAFPSNSENLATLQRQRTGKAPRSRLQAFVGCVLLRCGAGDTAFLPAGWLASREFLEVSVVTSAPPGKDRATCCQTMLTHVEKIALSIRKPERPIGCP